MTRKQMQSGFTLVEVMVALAITALVMSLLMGASYYVMQVRVKLIDEVRDGERIARERLWFRETVASIQPVPRESADAFTGDARRWRSMTLLPLDASNGSAPQVVEMTLEPGEEGETTLNYRSAGNTLRIASWTNAKVAFTYQNHDGQELDRWTTAEQVFERIPRAIAVKVNSADGASVEDYWFARIDAEPWMNPPRPPSFLLPGGG